MSLSINLSPGLLLFLRFPLPGYSMPMGINLSSALPLFLMLLLHVFFVDLQIFQIKVSS